MKIAIKPLIASSLVCALAAGFALTSGCSKQPVKSAEKTSFKEVTAQLDPGGSIYAYLSTDQWLAGLHEKLSSWREFTLKLPNTTAADRENIKKMFDILSRLIEQSGVESVSGVGFSGIALEPGFYRTKTLVHHYPDKGTGWLWKFANVKPHPLGGLDYLPAETAAAMFCDADIAGSWNAIGQQIAESGFPQANVALQTVGQFFENTTGQSIDKVLASLGEEHGILVTLDPANMMNLPMGPKPTQIPQPGLAIVTKVKNEVLYEVIEKQLKGKDFVVASEKNGVRLQTIAMPQLAMLKLSPTIARTGDVLILASSEDLVWQMLDVKAGKKPGLKSTDEFKKLARDLANAQGNGFTFVGRQFGETVRQLQKPPASAAGTQDAVIREAIISLMGEEPRVTFAVTSNNPDGWFTVTHGNSQPANIVVAPMVAGPAFVAGLMMPALSKAKAAAAAARSQM